MLLLRLRQGNRKYLVNIPEGSWLVRTDYGYPALVIPGAGRYGEDVHVLAPRIRDVAARGLHGLSLREERAGILTGTY
jgi:hypothetical protein